MYVFAETRTNEEKEIYEIIWVRKFYLKNEKEREVLETLIWIFTCSHNVTIAAFLYIIPYYCQQRTVYIKNRIICIRCFTLHFFFCFLF